MKLALKIFFVLEVCLTLLGGCIFITKEISSNNRDARYRETEARARAPQLIAEERLRSQFKIVFRDPAYLCATNTPARAALQHFLTTATEGNPSVEDLERLIEILARRPELIAPLKTLWTLPQVTFQQRQNFALQVDQGKIRYPQMSLDCILPPARLSNAEIETILKQVRPEGRVAEHVRAIQSLRKSFHQEVEAKRAAVRQRWEQARVDQQKQEREAERTWQKAVNASLQPPVVVRVDPGYKGVTDAQYRSLAETVKRVLFAPPDEFRPMLETVQTNANTDLLWRVLGDSLPKYERAIPSTNLVNWIDWAVSRHQATGDWCPRSICNELLYRRGLDRRVVRVCRSRFIELIQSGKLRGTDEGDDIAAFHDASRLLGCCYLEDEEIILAYDQAWAIAFFELCLKRSSFSWHRGPPDTRAEQEGGRALVGKMKAHRRQALVDGVLRKDYQAQALEIARASRPDKLLTEWFDYLDIIHRDARTGQSRRSSATLRPYGEMPLAEALALARKRLDEKRILWRAEDAAVDRAVACVRNWSVDSETVTRNMVTNLANTAFRQVILEAVRWNTNAIPMRTLRALVDWELTSNPDRNQDLYSLMRRPEWTADLLQSYYPALLTLAATNNCYQGVRGILDNPHVPPELSDRAYREPLLAGLRIDYLRQHYAQRLKTDVNMAIECEMASVEPQEYGSARKRSPRTDFLYCAANIRKVDRILKKYLPASRPADWSWHMSQPPFDFFMNDTDFDPPPSPFEQARSSRAR